MLTNAGRRAVRACQNRSLSQTRSFAKCQFLANIPMGPADPIFGIVDAYNKDKDPMKLNFSVGAYRDDDGKPVVLNAVREAEIRVLAEKLDMEYSPIGGKPGFVKEACRLLYPDDKMDCVAGMQSISGTGALRLAGALIARMSDGNPPPIYMSDPTWGNHIPIFQQCGLDVRKHRYFDAKTKGLDFHGMMEDMKAAPDGSAFLIHATAHNPTGVDPTPEQWKEISKTMMDKGHLTIFDCAYQGFASGDFEADKVGVTQFMNDGHTFLMCQSFAKNFGLYGHRVGCFSALCASPEEKERVASQMRITARAMYSNPPIAGARIVETVLTTPELKQMWLGEVKEMADRIKLMRRMLHDGLVKAGSTHSWQHILDQIGMFTYSGMTKDQCVKLRDDWHIHMTMNGRISMAGVTTKNVGRLAEAMHAVTK